MNPVSFTLENLLNFLCLESLLRVYLDLFVSSLGTCQKTSPTVSFETPLKTLQNLEEDPRTNHMYSIYYSNGHQDEEKTFKETQN